MTGSAGAEAVSRLPPSCESRARADGSDSREKLNRVASREGGIDEYGLSYVNKAIVPINWVVDALCLVGSLRLFQH